jgi:hypothetical protein
MQVTTTGLLEMLKATKGGYIARSASGELFLKEADGRDKLGPIQPKMVDDLEDQGYIRREGSKYRPTGR